MEVGLKSHPRQLNVFPINALCNKRVPGPNRAKTVNTFPLILVAKKKMKIRVTIKPFRSYSIDFLR